MNELIMRALSYVDDRWITEAMSDYETVKMKHFFQKERRKKYLCTAVCIAAAAFILSISLIWSIVHKNMNNHLDNHPLRPTLWKHNQNLNPCWKQSLSQSQKLLLRCIQKPQRIKFI